MADEQAVQATTGKATLVQLARAVVEAEQAYNAAWDKAERKRLAAASSAADCALEDAMGAGIVLARNVLALSGGRMLARLAGRNMRCPRGCPDGECRAFGECEAP